MSSPIEGPSSPSEVPSTPHNSPPEQQRMEDEPMEVEESASSSSLLDRRSVTVPQISISPTPGPSSPRIDLDDIIPPFSPDMLEDAVFYQLYRLYNQGKLSFNPEEALFSPFAPMITVEQAVTILKNLVCYWENMLMSGFDRILKLKLQEQNEAFWRFSQDHVLGREYDDSSSCPSYMK